MFSESKKNRSTQDNAFGLSNRIGKSTQITGDITSKQDFRIDGKLEGSINTTGKIVIGPAGAISGNVTCANADIEGSFSGKLIVSELLMLKKTATIDGDVTVSKLAVEPGATFNATCVMRTGIKELKESGAKKAEKSA